MVDDKASGGTQAPGSQAGTVAVPGKDEEVGAFGRGDDLLLNPHGSFHLGTRPPEALGRSPQELLSGSRGQLLHAGAGVEIRPAAAEEARIGAVGGTGDVVAGDVEQDHIGARWRMSTGGVDTGRPGAFDDPGDHGHGVPPPMRCSDVHSASTARTSAAGTVSSPSRVNSPRSMSVSCARMMRRHSRVAKDPV